MVSHTPSYLPYGSTLGAVIVKDAWAAGLDSPGSGLGVKTGVYEGVPLGSTLCRGGEVVSVGRGRNSCDADPTAAAADPRGHSGARRAPRGRTTLGRTYPRLG